MHSKTKIKGMICAILRGTLFFTNKSSKDEIADAIMEEEDSGIIEFWNFLISYI